MKEFALGCLFVICKGGSEYIWYCSAGLIIIGVVVKLLMPALGPFSLLKCIYLLEFGVSAAIV